MLQLVPLLAATVDHCPSGGVRVDHVCWQLSLPGQSCLDLCGGMVDRPLTINGASDTKVVHALDRGYGLGASYFDDLDQPCHTSWIKQVRQLHAWRLGESANLPAGRGGRAAGVRLLPWPRLLCPASCAPGS